MDVISIIVFIVLIALAFWRKVNMGVLAFAAGFSVMMVLDVALG